MMNKLVGAARRVWASRAIAAVRRRPWDAAGAGALALGGGLLVRRGVKRRRRRKEIGRQAMVGVAAARLRARGQKIKINAERNPYAPYFAQRETARLGLVRRWS